MWCPLSVSDPEGLTAALDRWYSWILFHTLSSSLLVWTGFRRPHYTLFWEITCHSHLSWWNARFHSALANGELQADFSVVFSDSGMMLSKTFISCDCAPFQLPSLKKMSFLGRKLLTRLDGICSSQCDYTSPKGKPVKPVPRPKRIPLQSEAWQCLLAFALQCPGSQLSSAGATGICASTASL